MPSSVLFESTAAVNWRRHAPLTAATLGLAAVAWFVAIGEMNGTGMGMGMATGPATRLGSFAFFIALWVAMMAAMMLPGAAAAVSRYAGSRARVGAAPIFLASYLVVWALVGVVVYAFYRPHGTAVAGAAVIAAGVYEFTPLKAHFRRKCRENVRSGFEFGLYCVGSSAGLMVVMVAISVMSVTWMAAIALVALAQKLLPPKAAIDVPLAAAIVGLGILVAATPSSIPGLMPPM